MLNVEIDLETLDTQPGAVILSIGAVIFTQSGGISDEFYTVVNRASCDMLGMTTSARTLAWWEKQSPEARAVLSQANEGGEYITDALASLRKFIPSDARVWSNGANFDLPLLDVAYHRIGESVPWKYYNARCHRTIIAMCPTETQLRSATVCAHNALEDAKWQAQHLIKVCDVLGIKI